MRLDKYLTEKFGSRTKAAAAISKGLVLVNGKNRAPSYDFKDGDELRFIESEESFVSLGGYKLSKALKDFGFSPEGKVFADIGASKGGFTDCLLQNGARKVYCIDVGESQLDESLKGDRTVVIDNFNARRLNRSMFGEKLDGVVIDVSFISLTCILGVVANVIDDGACVIALIKPQFECESRRVGKNGIVRGGDTHAKIIRKICDYSKQCNLLPQAITNAPIVAGKNMEYVILLKKNCRTFAETEYLLKSVKL